MKPSPQGCLTFIFADKLRYNSEVVKRGSVKAERKPTTFWLGRIFEPTVDFYALLLNQADKTLEGMSAMHEWLLDGAFHRCQRVRDLEDAADALKIDLEKKLVDSFVTPFDREDVFEVSACLDEVINGAKAIVREVEAFEVLPQQNPELLDMAELLVQGTKNLRESISLLRSDLKEAASQALLARKAENKFAKLYRRSMQLLLQQDDVKVILRVKEVYRQMLTASERIDRVGEKLQHVVVKMS